MRALIVVLLLAGSAAGQRLFTAQKVSCPREAESILIERIPGKSTIGIEVPNINRQTIALREILEAPEFMNSPSKLTLAMGRDFDYGTLRDLGMFDEGVPALAEAAWEIANAPAPS